MANLRLSIVSIVCCVLLLSINFEQCNGSKKYNRYLAHLFNKYGSGGTMSFEGLEHLMYNLGLGELEFSPTHTIDEHHPGGYKISDFIKIDEFNNVIEEEDTLLPPLMEEEDVRVVTHGTIKKDALVKTHKKTEQLTTTTASSISADRDVIDDIENEENLSKKNDIESKEFREMHDPLHRHPRDHAEHSNSNVCLSPKSLLRLVIDHDDLHKRKLYKTLNSDRHRDNADNDDDDHDSEHEYNEFINTVKLTPVGFMKLCPALLTQIDQQVCMQPVTLASMQDRDDFLLNAWIYASGSIFILSACGLLGILLVPLMKTIAYQEILKFLVAVAVGTLSGDALMHLIPHALAANHSESQSSSPKSSNNEESHDHSGPVWICACAFITAVFMYILETLLPLLKGDNSSHGHSHGHTESPPPVEVPATNPESREINVMLDELKKDKKDGSRPLTPIAFMVILGDGLHNLTDGLAIGAAFASDPVTGLATAFAVLCHELPHELGDFALLLQTGMSIRRAVLLNIASSVLSFVGMAIGLLIAGVHTNMTQWIYAATAGSFLYIAFADLIPAMSMEGKKNLKNSLIQVAGILVGGIIMMAIALNEDSLQKLFK
ncbi:zinc transporter ZIP10 [Episyrphus balteatus]|uniref:zinc transporter ZIP10 n=1 Tax=Episyrphus balteatus TaxID=286459 RepID=UPI0024868F00|nr:zinc transporter ZIP10 [Episyrphus balteatus]